MVWVCLSPNLTPVIDVAGQTYMWTAARHQHIVTILLEIGFYKNVFLFINSDNDSWISCQIFQWKIPVFHSDSADHDTENKKWHFLFLGRDFLMRWDTIDFKEINFSACIFWQNWRLLDNTVAEQSWAEIWRHEIKIPNEVHLGIPFLKKYYIVWYFRFFPHQNLWNQNFQGKSQQ